MNIREKVIEFIRLNPGCTSAQIADGSGVPRRLVQPLMSELSVEEVVVRSVFKTHPFFYRLAEESDRATLGEKYRQHRCIAEDLEKRNLWRRAAREWLMAMDATKDEAARDKATARREHCIMRGHYGVSYETSGVRVYSAPVTDMWRD